MSSIGLSRRALLPVALAVLVATLGTPQARATPPAPFNTCSSANLPAPVPNAATNTIIVDGQMTQAGQEANYAASNANGGLANANTTVAFRSVFSPIPLSPGNSGTDYGPSSTFSYEGTASAPSVAANWQVQYWQNNGYPFYYTAASSDFVVDEGASYLFDYECAGDAALRLSNDQGLYLHEVVAALAATQTNYNFPAAVNAITSQEWGTINYWVLLAKALNKKVIWSEPAQAWQALEQNATADSYFAQWGSTLVPTFGTNFDTPSSGFLMGGARQAAATVASEYGMPLGESVQSWNFREQADLGAQIAAGLPTAGATGSGTQTSTAEPPCCEVDPLNENSYESAPNVFYGDPLNDTLTNEEPSLVPTANATQSLADFGGSQGATYYEVEGTNGGYQVAGRGVYPDVDDMSWPSSGAGSASTFLQGIQQFSSQQLSGGAAPTSTIPTVPLYELWNPSLVSHYYTTATNGSGVPLDPSGNAAPNCNDDPASTVYCYEETPADPASPAAPLTPVPAGYVAINANAGEVPLYEYVSGSSAFYYTTHQSSVPAGYQLVSTIGYVMASQQPGTEPFYWMHAPGHGGPGDYFYTTDANSERPAELGAGYQDLGVNSWLFTYGPAPVVGAANPQGSWVGAFGSQGYSLAAWNGSSDLSSLSGVSLSVVSGTRYVWTKSTTDVRALQSPDQSTREATAWYDADQVQLQLNFSAAYSGNLHLYAVDWDAKGRSETITVDGQTVGVLRNFSQGAWVTVPISVGAGSSVTIDVTNNGGVNALLSGIFLGDAGPPYGT